MSSTEIDYVAGNIIDDQATRDAIEPLEGVAMAGEPRLHLLVAHKLGVLVTAPGERHDKKPGLHDLAGRGR